MSCNHDHTLVHNYTQETVHYHYSHQLLPFLDICMHHILLHRFYPTPTVNEAYMTEFTGSFYSQDCTIIILEIPGHIFHKSQIPHYHWYFHPHQNRLLYSSWRIVSQWTTVVLVEYSWLHCCNHLHTLLQHSLQQNHSQNIVAAHCHRYLPFQTHKKLLETGTSKLVLHPIPTYYIKENSNMNSCYNTKIYVHS